MIFLFIKGCVRFWTCWKRCSSKHDRRPSTGLDCWRKRACGQNWDEVMVYDWFFLCTYVNMLKRMRTLITKCCLEKFSAIVPYSLPTLAKNLFRSKSKHGDYRMYRLFSIVAHEIVLALPPLRDIPYLGTAMCEKGILITPTPMVHLWSLDVYNTV